MKPLLALTALLTLSASLAACTGPGPGLTGNDSGGIIPYPVVAAQSVGTSDRVVARAMADEHCARYNERAVNLNIHRQYGDYVSFDCSWR
jgi:hypothetical protein